MIVKVSFRKPFDFSNLKFGLFQTFTDAYEFRNVMESEGYITFDPYEVK
jgi:hypothetical protein